MLTALLLSFVEESSLQWQGACSACPQGNPERRRGAMAKGQPSVRGRSQRVDISDSSFFGESIWRHVLCGSSEGPQ